MSEKSLSDELASFKKEFTDLPEIDIPPKSTLRVLGRNHKEGSWNRLLTYLIDPEQPHGYGSDVLRQFLFALKNEGAITFHPSRYKLSEATVRREVGIDSGRIDFIINHETNWFVWVEMKVWSPEEDNQTQKYVVDSSIGEYEKTEFPDSTHHYVFLAREGEKPLVSDFIHVSWTTVVMRLSEVLSHGRSNYPLKSYVQLRDFIDTIKQEFGINMRADRHREPVEERVKLYHRYRDQIAALEESLEDYCEQEQDRWWITFLEEHRPENWNDEWYCREWDKRWGQIYHTSWTRQNPENVKKTPLLHYEHEWNPEYFKDGVLRFHLECEDKFSSSGNNELRKKIKELFVDEYADRVEAVKPSNTTVNSSKRDLKFLTESEYEFDFDGGRGYYESLREAFEDHFELSMVIVDIMDEVQRFDEFEKQLTEK